MGQTENTGVTDAPSRMASDAIDVESSRHIFFLPLRLKRNDKIEIQEVIDRQKQACLEAGWIWLKKPLEAHSLSPGATAGFDRFSYAELIYFHPYIRRILFGDENEARVTYLARQDVTDLSFTLPGTSRVYKVRVERLWLCLFDFGVAVAILEVDGDSTTLSDLLRLQNAVRRDYPPYFSFKNSPNEQEMGLAEYPLDVEIHCKNGKSHAFKLTGADFFDAVKADYKTPLAAHWGFLLAPLAIEGSLCTPPKSPPCTWQQTIDERLPTMTLAHVPNAFDIAPGDWVRLGSMDDPGSDPMPYGKHFLGQTFTPNAFYDRHWHQLGESGGMGTRYVISGFGFVVVSDNSWFANNLLRHHFSRMYATMGLLIHAQHAALLAISDEASNLNADDVTTMKTVQRRFNNFVQAFWFTNVSNQMQARELYEKWTSALSLITLYNEVREQIQDTVAIIDVSEQSKQAEAAMRLNTMAAIALPATVATGILGMNVVISDKALPGLFEAPLSLQLFFAATVFSGVYGLALLFMWLHNRRLKRDAPNAFSPFSLRSIGQIFAVTCTMMIASGVQALREPDTCKDRDLAICLIKKQTSPSLTPLENSPSKKT